MTRFLIGLVLIILAGYGIKEALPLMLGPSLSLSSPVAYAASPTGIVTVSGNARRVALLTLDGSPLLHDESGDFSTTRTFPHGTSVLTLVATDRFGRSVIEHSEVFVP